MKHLIDKQHLENLLIANWAEFVDMQQLFKYAKECVHNANLRYIEEIPPNKGLQLTISRFEWTNNGFLVWVDFIIPKENNQVAVGTIEMMLASSGEITNVATLGNILTKNSI